MSQALSDLTDKVTALEAHAAAVNAERVNLFVELQATKAAPPPVQPPDDAELAALAARVDAVSASIVAPVAGLVPPPAAPVEPAPAPAAPSA
jgi:hypothetical protein